MEINLIKTLGPQYASALAYIRKKCADGPARISYRDAEKEIGYNSEAWLRCRSRLRELGYIQEKKDIKGKVHIALPGQKFKDN